MFDPSLPIVIAKVKGALTNGATHIGLADAQAIFTVAYGDDPAAWPVPDSGYTYKGKIQHNHFKAGDVRSAMGLCTQRMNAMTAAFADGGALGPRTSPPVVNEPRVLMKGNVPDQVTRSTADDQAVIYAEEIDAICEHSVDVELSKRLLGEQMRNTNSHDVGMSFELLRADKPYLFPVEKYGEPRIKKSEDEGPKTNEHAEAAATAGGAPAKQVEGESEPKVSKPELHPDILDAMRKAGFPTDDEIYTFCTTPGNVITSIRDIGGRRAGQLRDWCALMDVWLAQESNDDSGEDTGDSDGTGEDATNESTETVAA